MDVVLDANMYLSDPRMEGVAFRSLLDYLRKTQSSLIVPQIVLDEVIARYPERLSAQLKRAISEVGSLRHLMLGSSVAKIPEVDPAREARALKRKLLKPSKHVRAITLKNFADISPEDVARRGVERIAPASGKGEELRDVMVWLMVLGYAKGSRRQTAFITADQHFRHEDKLHPHLARELQNKGVNLHFYISIDEFIKAHAPTPRELTATQAFELYGKSSVLDRFEIEARRYFPGQWRSASAIDVSDRHVEFTRGALYDVGPDSQYGEMEFSGELTLRVTTQSLGFASNVAPSLTSYDAKSFPSELSYPATRFSYELDQTWRIDPSGVINAINPAGIFAPSTTFLGRTPETAIDYKIPGKIVISIRLVSGKVTNIETERFEPGEAARLIQKAERT